MGKLHVGTSGWAYKEWKPDFYPPDLPQKRFLEHYGTQLSACEINATFYRRQSDETFHKWRDAVPDDFKFAVKAHRAISYTLDLTINERKQEIISEFGCSIRELDHKLGSVMLQFPHKDAQPDAALALLKALPEGLPYAFDFKRADVWDTPELREQLAGEGATICFNDRTAEAPDALPPDRSHTCGYASSATRRSSEQRGRTYCNESRPSEMSISSSSMRPVRRTIH